MEPRHNKRLTIPLLVTLLLLSLWVTGSVWLFSERQRVIEARETDLATLTIAVEEQTLRLFELTEISVQSIANWVEAHPKAHPAQTPSFNNLVSELRRVANGALDFRIIDAIDGKKAAAASQPMTKAANAVTNDRAICMPSGPPTRGLQIGDPVRSPVNNQWVVPVTLPCPERTGPCPSFAPFWSWTGLPSVSSCSGSNRTARSRSSRTTGLPCSARQRSRDQSADPLPAALSSLTI